MCINAFRYAGQLSEQDVRLISEKPEVVHVRTLSWLTLLTEGGHTFCKECRNVLNYASD